MFFLDNTHKSLTSDLESQAFSVSVHLIPLLFLRRLHSGRPRSTSYFEREFRAAPAGRVHLFTDSALRQATFLDKF
jgi:hypothetical protein